jgi:hypothetical protein
MEWDLILLTIVKGVATALITVIMGYVGFGVKLVFKRLSEKTNDASLQQIVANIELVAIEAIEATEQTLVKTAKAVGSWDEVKKGEAFKKTFDDIVAQLNEKAKTAIIKEYGNLDIWLTNKIEAIVKNIGK